MRRRSSFRGLLTSWPLGEMMAGSPSDADPLWTTMQEGGPFHADRDLTEYGKFLVATGRAEGLAELKRRHPEAFPNG